MEKRKECELNRWAEGISGGRPIAVPASWNDQFEDGRDYLGSAWYQTRFDLPWGWEQRQVRLRFGSVNYLAEVWLNGVRLGQHVWNVCDFKTPQEVRRMGGINLKGVFTRDRRPKMAAHRLRELWHAHKPGQR